MRALVISLLLAGRLVAYQYELTVCAIFQNEARWLQEWIEYHSVVGVEHFYLYSDGSNDGYCEVLAPYILEGRVDLVEWNRSPFGPQQHQAYIACLEDRGHESKWIAFIDIDEFLVPMCEESVVDVLRDYEEYPALAVNWITFGTCGVKELASDELLIEKLTRCAEDNHWYNGFIKSIVKPSETAELVTSHNFLYSGGRLAVGTDYVPVKPDVMRNESCPLDRLRINHYWGRTEDWAYGEKLRRVRAMKPEGWPSWRMARAVVDEVTGYGDAREEMTIQRFVPALKERLSSPRNRREEK